MKVARPRSRVARWLVRGAALAVLCGYVGVYAHLSRASLRDNAADLGREAILYVPLREVFPADHDARSPIRQRAIQRQIALATVFAPVHWVDQLLFGTPPPLTCFWMLSG